MRLPCIKKKESIKDALIDNKDDSHDSVVEQNETETVESSAGCVTVTGIGKNDVLFNMRDVGCIQARDSDGQIMFLLVKKNDDFWVMCDPSHDDWNEMVDLFAAPDKEGYINAREATVAQGARMRHVKSAQRPRLG